MTPDKIEYRPMQKSFIEATKNIVASGRNRLVANVAPGSGKTLASQAASNELYRSGLIDAAIVLTPRINLCQQFELDWKRDCKLFYAPVMGPIVHRSNIAPLVRGDQFGYATTYQSVVADPAIHLDFARKHRDRFALILDEAQMLGADESTGLGTQSAKYVEEVGQFAKFIFVMSGTPYRADGKPLIFATYTDPDPDGFRYLEADVSATYREGVTEKYLREFEYELFDGQALYEYLDGEVDNLVVSEMRSGISKIVNHQGFWGPLVDRTVEAVKERKALDRRLCGLIGAANQTHAKKITDYIEKHHKGTSATIAVSDENLAQDNLRQFKTGQYDILVTVAMAHVGYDHKPICVVAALNSYREPSWLDQFFARGMRVMDTIPYELQTLLCIVPDDPRMVKYVKDKRAESIQGIRDRGETEDGPKTGGGAVDIEPGITSWATVDGTRAMSLDPTLDLPQGEYEQVNKHRKDYNLGAVNITGFAKFCRDMYRTAEPQPSHRTTAPDRPMTTEKEWEEELRREIQKISAACDKILGVEYGYTAGFIKKSTGKSVDQCSKKELQIRLSWLRTEWRPKCEASRNGK